VIGRPSHGGSPRPGRDDGPAFASAGADVVIASRKLDNCKALAEEIEATGRRALPLACHVGHWNECDELADRAYEHFGAVDILVNNAGMSPLAPSSAQTSEELFDKVTGVNFKGPFRLSALIGQRMYDGTAAPSSTSPPAAPCSRRRGSGRTRAPRRPQRAHHGLRARVRAPGAGQHPVGRAVPHRHLQALAGRERASWRNAAGRAGEPGEVVTTALYLASAASSYTTGSLIRVDGGLY